MLSVFTKMNSGIEERHHGPSDALRNPSQPFKDKNKVCLLCEEILKQIPAFNFFCASLESIIAIENTWEWVEVWDDIPTLHLGFVLGGKNGVWVRLKVKLEPDEWTKDSGCSRHMTGNKDLSSTYEAINEVNIEQLVKFNLKPHILELKRRNHEEHCFDILYDECMIRSSTKDLFAPFEGPERVFHSTRKLFKTTSLDYLSLPEFNLFFDLEDQIEEKVTETMTKPTMEEYMTKTREDYGSGIASPKFDKKAHFELKGQLLKKIRDNTFSGSDNEDVNKHIEKVLDCLCLLIRL
ncbi:hypothetical protein Tco_1054111 [Tanacetum coccineum]|uniref:Uncharacterized protein n=1 Tax=Tanacetum coccineum TaxID=301880 RepID=A0ABQ5GWW1_9ASTR